MHLQVNESNLRIVYRYMVKVHLWSSQRLCMMCVVCWMGCVWQLLGWWQMLEKLDFHRKVAKWLLLVGIAVLAVFGKSTVFWDFVHNCAFGE